MLIYHRFHPTMCSVIRRGGGCRHGTMGRRYNRTTHIGTAAAAAAAAAAATGIMVKRK